METVSAKNVLIIVRNAQAYNMTNVLNVMITDMEILVYADKGIQLIYQIKNAKIVV